MKPALVVVSILLGACGIGNPTAITNPPMPAPEVTAEAPITNGPSTTLAVASLPATTAPVSTDEFADFALRMVHNQLAALAAGQFELAAGFSANDVAERIAEIESACANGACQGPYQVDPIEISADNYQARFRIAHVPSGTSSEMLVGKFEFTFFVSGLPPLVASPPSPVIASELFGPDSSERVVVERLGAFEITESGDARWVHSGWAGQTWDWEGDLLASVREVGRPERNEPLLVSGSSFDLMTRGDHVTVLDTSETDWWMYDLTADREIHPPIPYRQLGDGSFVWFTERGSTVVEGIGNAEGNISGLTTLEGVELSGADSSSLPTLSVDGSMLAYIDHSDERSIDHFWSPVLVIKDTATGAELQRVDVGYPIKSLAFGREWVLASGADPAQISGGRPGQIALVAVQALTAEMITVMSPVKVFLPT